MLKHIIRRFAESLLHGKSHHRPGPYYKRYTSSAGKPHGYGQPPHYGHNKYGSQYYKKKHSSFFSS